MADFEDASVILHNSLADRQPESRAPAFGGVEGDEEVGDGLIREPRSVVADRNGDGVATRESPRTETGVEDDGRGIFGFSGDQEDRIQRVEDHVVEDLLERMSDRIEGRGDGAARHLVVWRPDPQASDSTSDDESDEQSDPQ